MINIDIYQTYNLGLYLILLIGLITTLVSMYFIIPKTIMKNYTYCAMFGVGSLFYTIFTFTY